ncbi:hypothetical protein [Actinoplanes sp. HUAS TT8]|uniref:hypothetical protein n=1 Tax=Actinoplanes sp. HUAS TT8 TaxID=3447453 RepID=UPI003F526E5C
MTALGGLAERVRQVAPWWPFNTVETRCPYCHTWRKPRHFRPGARGCRRCIGC